MNKSLPQNPEMDKKTWEAFIASLNNDNSDAEQPSDVVYLYQQIQWLATQVKQLNDNQTLMINTMKLMSSKIGELYA